MNEQIFFRFEERQIETSKELQLLFISTAYILHIIILHYHHQASYIITNNSEKNSKKQITFTE